MHSPPHVITYRYYRCLTLSFSLRACVHAEFVRYDSFMKLSPLTKAVDLLPWLIVCKQGVSKWLSIRKWPIISAAMFSPYMGALPEVQVILGLTF